MNRTYDFFNNRLLGRRLEFRVRLFNMLAIAGTLVSLVAAISAIINGEGLITAVTCLATSIIAVFLLVFATKSGRYQLCYMITIVIIFFVFFPYIFFIGGGYESSMPMYFIFAVVFTVFMLEGVKAFITTSLEIIAYSALIALAYLRPELVTPLPGIRETAIDNIVGLVIVSVALGLTIFLHFRGYNQQQRELEKAHKDALTASNAKNAFLANMSHEIRTPINVMLGMTDMVLRDSRDDAVIEYARKIRNAGDMLLILVNNILDLSKIESGKLEQHEDSYNTAKLIKELYEIGADSARKRGLAYKVVANKELPSKLFGDMQRIKQIATNFISNAVKYTGAGSVTVGFSLIATGADEQAILNISVSDTGDGIEKENLGVIFDAFSRIDMPKYQNIEGTGLGLAIARQIAENMNGGVFVESEYGKGSTFWLEVPQKIIDSEPMGDWNLYEDEPDANSSESFTAPEARVLVVDDNRENLETIEALLRRTLMRVDLVDSGARCIDAVKETDYHVILMDYMMPDLDGIETFRQLRGIPGFNTPVVALTANAVAGTEEKLLAEGFSSYITKPVSAKELEEELTAMLALASVPVAKRTIYAQTWATPELKEILARDLAVCGVVLEEGLKNAGGDLSLLARMAEVIVNNYGDSLAGVQNAYKEADYEDLRRRAHSLKSAAGYVGASDLSFHAKLIEHGCREGNGEVISLALPLLFLEWEQAAGALSAFAAHIHAVEPKDKQEMADTNIYTAGCSLKELSGYIKRRVRRGALRELDRLIGQTAGDCPGYLMETKRALNELDFSLAERILTENGIWED